MIGKLGEFFGELIVILYLLTILNYFVKLINRKYRNKIMQNKKLFSVFTKAMRFIVKNHKLFGLSTIIFILLHFFVQFSQYGLRISGVVAAGIMILQIGLGIYGSKVKKRGKVWLYLHRSIAVILAVAIMVHTA